MPAFTSLVGDVRALGSSAPLRAAYEASKRSNFHALLFREIRRPAPRSTPLGLARIPESRVARARCLEDAKRVVADGTRVFGRRVATGVHGSWCLDPLTGATWPELTPWWRIDIRSTERLSDVKHVWEAARHRDLVVLARAAAIDPAGPWLPQLETMLGAWLEQCAPERGVNWYSSLELALRAIAWAQVIDLVGEQLDPPVRAGMDAQLVASARHIMLELPYTVSSMKNNHLLGDGLGLVVLGRMFPDLSASSRWRGIGDRLMLKQLGRHMHADGSMIEDSLSYHRFVLEMLVVRVLLGGADIFVSTSLDAAAHHLRRLGALEGDVPQFGDWDEGRVLADSHEAGSVAGSTWCGLALSGWEVPATCWDDHDELAWYVPLGTDDESSLQGIPTQRQAGDFHVLEHGPWKVWVKSGGGESHQHADLTSVWIARQGEWITQDPGTGTYNGPLAVRNGMRSSQAHPVWTPEGEDQLVPHRAFRWLRRVECRSTALLGAQRSLCLVVHDAFVGTDTGSRVARLVDVDVDGVRVVDFLERVGDSAWTMTIPLGRTASAEMLQGLEGSVVAGQEEPFAGWISPTYGAWEAAEWLRVQTRSSTCGWGVGVVDPTAAARPGAAAFGRREYSVDWASDSVVVTVTEASSVQRLEVGRG